MPDLRVFEKRKFDIPTMFFNLSNQRFIGPNIKTILDEIITICTRLQVLTANYPHPKKNQAKIKELLESLDQ